MSKPSAKHVVFDVVGTCVSFDAFYARITAAIGPRLLSNSITPPHFGFTWMTAAELEFTFLSISGRYRPYKQVLTALFYRSLFMAGIAEPRSFATEAERDAMVAGYAELQLRDGCSEMFSMLREASFTVWVLTTGDVQRVRGYFLNAGVDMPLGNFVSCDARGEAKPALGAYQAVLEQFGELDEKWFAAAHMWDVSAAKKAGFRGAYCTVYEKESCAEIFDVEMDAIADTLPEMAAKMIAASS